MGRYKFRLSDMIPNAWFYKLKDMRSRNAKNNATKKATRLPATQKPFPPPPPSPVKHAINPGRASYYFQRSDEKLGDSPAHPKASDTKFLLVDPPRNSRKKSRTAKVPSTKLVRSSVSSHCSCRATVGSMCKAESMTEYPSQHRSPVRYDDDFDGLPCSDKPVIAEHFTGEVPSRSCSSCSSRITTSPPDSSSKSSSDVAGEVDLPPILTKPPKRDVGPNSNTKPQPLQQGRRYPEGLKLRGNSPRLAKLQGHRCRRSGMVTTPRKGLSGSFAVVKASSDPRRDFMESMVEMIIENNINTSKELEDLLVCFLSLNSREYHDMIIKVFEQIWFDLTTKVRL